MSGRARAGRALGLVALAWVVGCGPRGVGDQLELYRAEVEATLGADPSASTTRVRLGLPARRDRRIAVSDERIGPFDFLAIVGCRLSEVVAERNNALGRVREPTRRLAYELEAIEAIEACLPGLGGERARDLAERLGRKRDELPAVAWNAVWLDADLERYLSAGPRSLVGGEDAADGPGQLARAAAAVASRDVPALEAAFAQLRDDPAAAPLFGEWRAATAALERVAALVDRAGEPGCGRTRRRLARVFEHRFLPYPPALGRLQREASERIGGIASLYRATADAVAVPGPMRAYLAVLVGEGADDGLAGRFREASVAHAEAWGPILEACGVLPEGPADRAGRAQAAAGGTT